MGRRRKPLARQLPDGRPCQLSKSESDFVEQYTSGDTKGNLVQTAHALGTTTARAYAVLNRPRVSNAIRQILGPGGWAKDVASRIERQAMLTEIARDTKQETKDRIAAIKTLGQMEGDFTVNVKSEVSVAIGDGSFDALMAAAKQRMIEGQTHAAMPVALKEIEDGPDDD